MNSNRLPAAFSSSFLTIIPIAGVKNQGKTQKANIPAVKKIDLTTLCPKHKLLC
jgi:hypothetical protein